MSTFQQFTKNQRVEKELFVYKEGNPTADHSTINIFRAIIEDQDEKHPNILQSHSMLPEEDGSNNIETNVDLSHLVAQITEMFTDIRRKYPDLYARSKHDIGMFNGFEVQADIDQSLNSKQKQRSRFLPVAALQDLEKYFQADVFSFSDGGEDKYCSNITLTRRPQAKEVNETTKADKNINKQLIIVS